jgi:hypothetical protein
VGGDATVVSFADLPDVEGEVWVRPDMELEAVQSVAPLERPLERYGIYEIDGPTTIDITDAGLEGGVETSPWETVLDWFAPAQYDDLSRTEKLAAPSYEEMVGGVRFGATGVSLSDAEAVTVTPDYEVRILDEDRTVDLGVQPMLGALGQALVTLGLDPAGKRRSRTVTSTTFAVGEPTWRLADATTAISTGGSGSYREALAARRASVAADPGAGAATRIAPGYATLTPEGPIDKGPIDKGPIDKGPIEPRRPRRTRTR